MNVLHRVLGGKEERMLLEHIQLCVVLHVTQFLLRFHRRRMCGMTLTPQFAFLMSQHAVGTEFPSTATADPRASIFVVSWYHVHSAIHPASLGAFLGTSGTPCTTKTLGYTE